MSIQKLWKETPTDLKTHTAAIAALADEIWHEYYTSITGVEQVDYMLEKYQSAQQIYTDIMNNEFTYFTATDEEAGALVGYSAAQPQEDYLLLSKIYVRSDYRGKGLARSFLKEITTLCHRVCGLDKIRLTVNKQNCGAIAVYKQMGFTIVEAIKKDIGEGFFMDDYVMELTLPHGPECHN